MKKTLKNLFVAFILVVGLISTTFASNYKVGFIKPDEKHVIVSVSDIDNADVNIYDPQGRNIYHDTISNSIRFDLSNLEKGEYKIYVSYKDETYIKTVQL